MNKFIISLLVILFSFSTTATSQIDKSKYSTKAINRGGTQKLKANNVRISKPEYHLVNLKTIGGYFYAADYSGSGPITAFNEMPYSQGQFTLKDLNGGKLESGDKVELRTFTDKLVFADGSGLVSSIEFLTKGIEVLTILKVFGEGEINMGDAIFLKSSSGKYLSAENGGGAGINASALVPQLKEAVIISEGWIQEEDAEKEIVSRSILPGGVIRIVYSDGIIVEQSNSGQVTIYPNGERMALSYYQAQPPEMPPPPSDEQAKWLDTHAEELLGFIKALVGNDQASIDEYLKSEHNQDVYNKIWRRSYTIDQLLP